MLQWAELKLWRVCFVLGWIEHVPNSTKERTSMVADDEDVPGSYLLFVITALIVIAVAAMTAFVILIRS
jgi:hypothetical protein